jgi:hypothetical protein
MILLEQIDRRVLGAVRFVDATTRRWIQQPLDVSAPLTRLVRNGQGAYVVTAAPQLADHVDAFVTPPGVPALGDASVTLSVSDPSGRYLARRVVVALPRDPDPAHADQADSLFRAVEAPLYPSPAGEVAVGAAALRATVRKVGGGGLGGVLLRVVRGTVVLARGLSDVRGEALVTVPGIPTMTWEGGGDAVLSPETEVTVTAYFDAAATLPPDPDDLERRRASLASASRTVRLASRREDVLLLELTV